MEDPVRSCLIADDHAMMRGALAGAVRLIWPGAEVAAVGGFDEAAEALTAKAMTDRSFDLVLCDLAMPGAGPLDGVARLMALAGKTPVLIVTGSEDDATLLSLLDLGVAGFLSKTESGPVVESAIALVAAGGCYLPPRLLGLIGESARPAPPPASPHLTARQRDVLVLLMQGASNKEIARGLGLSPSTVKVHVAALLAALKARNRAEAVARARDQGWPNR